MAASRRILALIILALALAAGGVAGFRYFSSAPTPGVGALTGAEIRVLVSGNTVKGPKFSEYYAPDGSIRGREIEDTDEEYLGTWQVDGDRLCVAFPSHDYKSCVVVTRQQDGAYDFAAGEQHGTRAIVAGNPNNL